MNKSFLIKSGNNGATYIFNTKDINNINYSLKFYKAFTTRQKMVKTVLFMYLFFISIFKKSKLIDKSEVLAFLKKNTLENIDFSLFDDSSILISPTKDKIIVHNHKENSFYKYAFAKSLDGVKNESSIYEFLENEHKTFNTSKISGYEVFNNYCKFKLSNEDFKLKSDDIVSISQEFFKVKLSHMTLDKYFESRFSNRSKNLDSFYDYFIKTYKDINLLLGLVHKDYKPWNMDMSQGPLIYDFEETTFALALEDFLNYYIDPMLSTYTQNEIIDFIFTKDFQTKIDRYLDNLDIKENKEFYIYQYIFERAYFWDKKDKADISQKYINILKVLLNDK